MHLPPVAATILVGSAPLAAQSVPDLATAVPVAGAWTYAATNDGSEARFVDPSAIAQLIVHCTRSTRQVSISKPASAPSAFLNIWTSSQQRSVASAFNPAAARLTIDFQPYDTLLDAISTSRGRIGVSVGAQPPLVVPQWPQVARVIEDCRA